MALFEEYKNHPDPFVRERANNWAIAIGLQRVDRHNVSDFLIQVAVATEKVDTGRDKAGRSSDCLSQISNADGYSASSHLCEGFCG